MINSYFIVLRGIPASGKTIFANKLLQKIPECKVISNGIYVIDEEINTEYDNLFNKLINNNEKIIIANNLNLTQKNYFKYVQIAKRNNYIIIGISFEYGEINYHVENNSYGLGYNEIRKLIKNYTLSNRFAKERFFIKHDNYEEDCKKTIEDIYNIVNKKSVFKSKPKPTAKQYDERINIIFSYLCNGILSTDMWEYISKKHKDWNISRTTTLRYIKKANEIYKQLAEKNKEVEFGKSVARLSMLFDKSLNLKDYRTCLAIEKERNELFGLYEAEKHEIIIKTKIIEPGDEAIDN